MLKRFLICSILLPLCMGLLALPNREGVLLTGDARRLVVMAQFADGLSFEHGRDYYESFFNGRDEYSLQSYIKAISNNHLIVVSDIYPLGGDAPYVLKYCFYCYDSSTAKDFPACKGADISAGYTDVSIGFVVKELSEKIGDIDASGYDKDNDGYIDDFVILLSGGGVGKNKGIQSPHVGEISERFISAHGEPRIGNKKIGRYTILYERNSLDTHCRFFLERHGFPYLYRSGDYLPRAVGQWDVMDGPLLTYPLVYSRWKYSLGQWVDDIPLLQPNKRYVLNSSDKSSGIAYKIETANPHEYFVMEYRNNQTAYNRHLPSSGLLVYRVNDTITGVLTDVPEIYLFRKDGTVGMNGDLSKAAFSMANASPVFDKQTNPFPFMADGTVVDIALYGIEEQGDGTLAFCTGEFAGTESFVVNNLSAYPNPATGYLYVTGDWNNLRFWSIDGRVVLTSRHWDAVTKVDVRHLPEGIYLLEVIRDSGSVIMKVVIN